MERLVKFEVLGQEYPLYTDAPEEDVEEILQLVKFQLENTELNAKHVLPANKLAILTSLNMAAKYVRLKRDFEDYRSKVGESLSRVTDKIENYL